MTNSKVNRFELPNIDRVYYQLSYPFDVIFYELVPETLFTAEQACFRHFVLFCSVKHIRGFCVSLIFFIGAVGWGLVTYALQSYVIENGTMLTPCKIDISIYIYTYIY